MADTIREQIIQGIDTALGKILIAKGYNTNIGLDVMRVERKRSPDSADACVYFPGDEVSVLAYGLHENLMTMHVEGGAIFGSTNPSIVSEKLLGDLIEALTGQEWTLAFDNGSTEILQDQTLDQAATGASAYVESVSVTGGTWGGGDAAGTVTLRRLSGTFAAGDLEVASSKVAETDGSITWQSAADRITGGLADSIIYEGGGPGEHPEAGDTVVGAGVDVKVEYKTLAGNPYSA